MVVGKLYSTEVSPPVRGVFLVEKALGIKTEHVEVSLINGEHLKEEYLKLNPQHTVPLYVDQDGTKVWDSHAISAYLVGKYGKDDSLYPKDLAKRALVDQRLHFDTGNVFSILRGIVFPMWAEGEKTYTPRQKKLVEDAYNFLNIFLEGEQWIAGKQLTIADLSLISSVSSLRHIIPIDAKYGNLIAWTQRCQKLPYYRETNGQGEEKFRDFIQNIMKS